MPTALEIVEIAAAATGATALVAGGLIYSSLAPASRVFGAALTAPPNPVNGLPQFALTFDDGPNPRWTPPLLELLAHYEVKATFFLIGMYATKQKRIAREIQAAGHLIGNHTWTHPNLARTSPAKTYQELNDTNEELQQILGARVRYFRPPFGLRKPGTFRIARELGLIPVTWNIIGNDWTELTAEQITERVTRLMGKNRQRGEATNLVLHDGSHRTPEADRSRSVTATEMLLEKYRQSYEFVRLDVWETFAIKRVGL